MFLAKLTQALEPIISCIMWLSDSLITVAQARSTSAWALPSGQSQIRVGLTVGSDSGSIHSVSNRHSGFVRKLRVLKFRSETSLPVRRRTEYVAQLLKLGGVGMPKDLLAQRVYARQRPTERDAKARSKHFVSPLSVIWFRLLRQGRCDAPIAGAAIRSKGAGFRDRLFLLPELVHLRALCMVVKGVYVSAVFA